MSDFVRYSPEIETFDPKLSEYMTRIIDFWETKVRESPTTEGTGRAVRGAHAKTIGVARAEVEILGDAPAPYAQGIYATARPPRCADPVLQRLEPPGPGRAARTRSGLRDQDLRHRRDQAGRRRAGRDDVRPRAEEQPDLHRQYGEALPVHPGDRRPGRRLLGAREAGVPRTPERLPHRQGHARAGGLGVGGAVRVRERRRRRRRCAIRCSARTGRWRRYATATTSPRSASLRPRTAPRMPFTTNSTSAAARTCSVRPWWTNCERTRSISTFRCSCAPISTAMPVNDATVEWPEKLSPFVTVGRVHLPRQDISGPENVEKGDALAFNQWRVTSDHRPMGEIMDVRRVYTASAKVRRALNHQPQREPTSADEVLAWPGSNRDVIASSEQLVSGASSAEHSYRRTGSDDQ